MQIIVTKQEIKEMKDLHSFYESDGQPGMAKHFLNKYLEYGAFTIIYNELYIGNN